MEVEQAIMLSLSEPLFRDELFQKTRETLRKAKEKPTYRTKFNKALRRLVSDGWIIKHPKKEGKVYYELQRNKLVSGKKWFEDFQKLQEEKIFYVIRSLGEIGEEILEKHKNKIEILPNDKIKYQIIVYSALFLLLEYQKYFFFMKNIPLDYPSIESTSEKQIKNIEKTLSLVLKPISKILDEESLAAIYESAVRSMSSSIQEHEDRIKKIKEIFSEKT